MRFIVLAVFGGLFGAAVTGAPLRDDRSGVIFDSLCLSPAGIRERSEFVGDIDARLKSAFRPESLTRTNIPRHVFLVEKSFMRENIRVVAAGGKVMIYLPSDTAVWASDPGAVSRLAAALLLPRCGIFPPEDDNGLPRWVAAAVIRKAERGRAPGAGLPGFVPYPWLCMLAEAGSSPSLMRLLDQPALPEDGEAYEIHAEACELLLDACARLSSKKENGMLDSLILLSGGKKHSDEEIFKMSMGPLIFSERRLAAEKSGIKRRPGPPDALLDEWFADEFRRVVRGMRRELPARIAAKKLDAIKALARAAGPSAARRKTLSEADAAAEAAAAPLASRRDFDCLLERWPLRDERDAFAAELRDELSRLELELPEGFSPAFQKYIMAVNSAMSGNGKSYRENYDAAEAVFAGALKFMADTERLLRDEERARMTFHDRYSRILSLAAGMDSAPRRIWPKLADYLDSVESAR